MAGHIRLTFLTSGSQRIKRVNGLVLHFVLRLSVEGKALPEGFNGLNGREKTIYSICFIRSIR